MAHHLPHTEDDSPYPEVRSAVANTDDPSIPVGTLRAWIMGEFTTDSLASWLTPIQAFSGSLSYPV